MTLMNNPEVIGGIVLALAGWFFVTVILGVRREVARRKREEINRSSARLAKKILLEEREKARLRDRL